MNENRQSKNCLECGHLKIEHRVGGLGCVAKWVGNIGCFCHQSFDPIGGTEVALGSLTEQITGYRTTMRPSDTSDKKEEKVVSHSPHLPTDAKERKKIPLYSGLFKYFPDALVAVAKVSQAGNDQHNPGQPLHWSREKSSDHEDTLLRHLMDIGTTDTDGHLHAAKLCWRSLALLQLEIEHNRELNAKS